VKALYAALAVCAFSSTNGAGHNGVSIAGVVVGAGGGGGFASVTPIRVKTLAQMRWDLEFVAHLYHAVMPSDF
jgi:hypothetical protein